MATMNRGSRVEDIRWKLRGKRMGDVRWLLRAGTEYRMSDAVWNVFLFFASRPTLKVRLGPLRHL